MNLGFLHLLSPPFTPKEFEDARLQNPDCLHLLFISEPVSSDEEAHLDNMLKESFRLVQPQVHFGLFGRRGGKGMDNWLSFKESISKIDKYIPENVRQTRHAFLLTKRLESLGEKSS